MSIKQLYDLQCLEQSLAANEQTLTKARAQIGESPALKQARTNLTRSSASLSSTVAEQKNTEDILADLSAKIATANDSLYSGRIQNIKELQNLQLEITLWQSQREPLEAKGLMLMDRIEQEGMQVRLRQDELTAAEEQWRAEQTTLQDKIKTYEQDIKDLKCQCEIARAQIPAGETAMYSQLRTTHGLAISRLEQGSCGHCRLSLSTAALQRARAGQLANCPSCGRLLFSE